jgi:hypothetical protein
MRSFRSIALVVISVGVTACGGSTSDATDTPPVTPTASADWTGTLVGATASGSVSLAFASPVSAAHAMPEAPAIAAGTVAVTGTLRLVGGATITLSGTYDPATHAFTVTGTGSGGTFSLTGTVTSSGIRGTFTGPAGASGTFSALAGASSTVAVYCGTYTGTGGSGTWNLMVAGSTAAGIAFASSENIPLAGTVSGSSLNLTFTQTNGTLTANGTATGTFSGTGVSGTFSEAIVGTGAVVNSGTFTGSRC